MEELNLISEFGINNNREVRNKDRYVISECHLNAQELIEEITREDIN